MVYARHNLGYGQSLLSILCSTTEERRGQCQGVYAYSSSLTSKKNKKNDELIYAVCCYVSLPKNRDRTGTAEQLDEKRG